MKRVGIFVDISNLYFCVSRNYKNRRVDYSKFLDYVKDFGEVTTAIGYGSQIKDEAIAFITCLEDLGFQTKYKSPKQWADKEGGFTRKADWDVGITIDVIEKCNDLDTIVLGCADGDLEPLVGFLKARGKSVIILACGISRDLREAADECIEIPESLLEAKRKKRSKHETSQNADT